MRLKEKAGSYSVLMTILYLFLKQPIKPYAQQNIPKWCQVSKQNKQTSQRNPRQTRTLVRKQEKSNGFLGTETPPHF